MGPRDFRWQYRLINCFFPRPVYFNCCRDALQYTPGKYEISRRENRCILKIKKADKDDGAEFRCEVEGDQTQCKVTIEGMNDRWILTPWVPWVSRLKFNRWICYTPFTRYNRLSNHVERTATVRSTGCQTALYNRFDNRLYTPYSRFDNRLHRVNGALVTSEKLLCYTDELQRYNFACSCCWRS